jgi:hypothetical protein
VAAAVKPARQRWIATNASLDVLACLNPVQKSLVKPLVRYAVVEDAVWSAEPLRRATRIFLALVAVGLLTVVPAVVSFPRPPTGNPATIVFLATYIATAGLLVALPNLWFERLLPPLGWSGIGSMYAVVSVNWAVPDLPRWLELATTGVLTAGSLLATCYITAWFARQIRSRLSWPAVAQRRRTTSVAGMVSARLVRLLILLEPLAQSAGRSASGRRDSHRAIAAMAAEVELSIPYELKAAGAGPAELAEAKRLCRHAAHNVARLSERFASINSPAGFHDLLSETAGTACRLVHGDWGVLLAGVEPPKRVAAWRRVTWLVPVAALVLASVALPFASKFGASPTVAGQLGLLITAIATIAGLSPDVQKSITENYQKASK